MTEEELTKLKFWITERKVRIAQSAKLNHSLALGIAEGTLDELEAFFEAKPKSRHVIIKL